MVAMKCGRFRAATQRVGVAAIRHVPRRFLTVFLGQAVWMDWFVFYH